MGSDREMGGEATLLKEFVGFLPLFLLHISTGMTASFTTILIHYFEHTQPHLKEYSTLIGTSERVGGDSGGGKPDHHKQRRKGQGCIQRCLRGRNLEEVH